MIVIKADFIPSTTMKTIKQCTKKSVLVEVSWNMILSSTWRYDQPVSRQCKNLDCLWSSYLFVYKDNPITLTMHSLGHVIR